MGMKLIVIDKRLSLIFIFFFGLLSQNLFSKILLEPKDEFFVKKLEYQSFKKNILIDTTTFPIWTPPIEDSNESLIQIIENEFIFSNSLSGYFSSELNPLRGISDNFRDRRSISFSKEIVFDERKPEELMIMELIDTVAFQRLRRIKQLGAASLLFHGAESSRFTHSIGVFCIARKIYKRLIESKSSFCENKFVLYGAALLHDLGHGPLSHTSETIFKHDHEQWSANLVKNYTTHIIPGCGHMIMIEKAFEMREKVLEFLKK